MQHDPAERVSPLEAVGDRLSRLGLALAGVGLVVVIVLNFANVVLRYAFFHPLPWAEELMLFLMIFSVYTGAVSAAWEQRHIRLDGIVGLAPARWRRALDVLTSLIVVGILSPVIYASANVVALLFEFEQRSDALHLPIWIPQSVIPAAFVLIVIATLARIFAPGRGHHSPERDLLENG